MSPAQGEEVKKISFWAASLFGPTLVSVVYGENFDLMPKLHWKYGYPFVISLMLALSVTLFVVFRRQWV